MNFHDETEKIGSDKKYLLKLSCKLDYTICSRMIINVTIYEAASLFLACRISLLHNRASKQLYCSLQPYNLHIRATSSMCKIQISMKTSLYETVVIHVLPMEGS